MSNLKVWLLTIKLNGKVSSQRLAFAPTKSSALEKILNSLDGIDYNRALAKHSLKEIENLDTIFKLDIGYAGEGHY